MFRSLPQKLTIWSHFLFLGLFFSVVIFAASVTTSVTAGNSAPEFTAGPAEIPASSSTNPTNAGATLTFSATAADENNEPYYFIVCKTNSVIPGEAGDPPSCADGNWCISSLTASGAAASCEYETSEADEESNQWYAFVCDNNTGSSSCSSASQGSGESASPFEVNHAPEFTDISNNGPQNPGGTVTWTSTAADNDTSSTADQVKLIVCKTEGISGDDCSGGAADRWCESSFSSEDPSCSYELPIPTADQVYNAYAYIVDSHEFGSSSTLQGDDSSYTVNNVSPVVSGVSINADDDIDLTSGQVSAVEVTATVSDNNSCSTAELEIVEAFVYRSGISFAGCNSLGSANHNHCYPKITCIQDVGSCSSPGGASATYTCTASLQYFADPTDTDTQYTSEHWLATVQAVDDNASGHTEDSASVEINSLTALDVSSEIAYGSLATNQKNDPLDKIMLVTAAGNVGIDQELSGTDMTSGANSIAVGYQKYSLSSATAYADGTALTTSPVFSAINVPKTVTVGDPGQKNTWWGIEIPEGTVPGTYLGQNAVTAIKSAVANW